MTRRRWWSCCCGWVCHSCGSWSCGCGCSTLCRTCRSSLIRCFATRRRWWSCCCGLVCHSCGSWSCGCGCSTLCRTCRSSLFRCFATRRRWWSCSGLADFRKSDSSSSLALARSRSPDCGLLLRFDGLGSQTSDCGSRVALLDHHTTFGPPGRCVRLAIRRCCHLPRSLGHSRGRSGRSEGATGLTQCADVRLPSCSSVGLSRGLNDADVARTRRGVGLCNRRRSRPDDGGGRRCGTGSRTGCARPRPACSKGPTTS